MEPASKWTDTELSSDAVSKKMIVEFLQANASSAFLSERKLVGKVDNVAKANGKDALVKTYHQLYETKVSSPRTLISSNIDVLLKNNFGKLQLCVCSNICRLSEILKKKRKRMLKRLPLLRLLLLQSRRRRWKRKKR